jgi:mannitol/fructose-specific phosphotransferase system IIA component (Ntr-type)
MRLSDFFVCTVALGAEGLPPLGQEVLLGALLARPAATGHLPPDAVRPVLDAVLRREQLGSTGIGRGLAIPHPRHPAVARPLGVLAVCRPPVPFNSLDGEPVDLVALCLAPPDDPGLHLGQTWRGSEGLFRALRDEAWGRRLRRARSAEEVAARVWAAGGGMTASDWLGCRDPLALLGVLRDRGGSASGRPGCSPWPAAAATGTC